MRAAFSQLPTENWRKHSPIRQKSMNVESFLSLARKYTDIQELTGEIIREFVEKIIVFKAEKVDGYRQQCIRIIYTTIGVIEILNEKSLRSTF